LYYFPRAVRSTRSLEELDQTFSGRLQALARAQALLTSPEAGALNLHMMLQEQLAAAGGGAQVTCRGPDVILPHYDALDLGPVLYELSTNACKFGALSSQTGPVRVEWRVKKIEDSPKVELFWREEDGPPVGAPQRTGFGSHLIRHALKSKGGDAEIRYEPTGVVCQIRLPLK
jgi:two-component sensor histidine kinase